MPRTRACTCAASHPRGWPGGLAEIVPQLTPLLEAWGADVVLIETVGVGQAEVAVTGVVDVACLVLTPDGGDEVQAGKAGILELADVVVVNKSDIAPASGWAASIEGILRLGDRSLPAIVSTATLNGTGVAELWGSILGAARQRARERQAPRTAPSTRGDRGIAEDVRAAVLDGTIDADGLVDACIDGAADLDDARQWVRSRLVALYSSTDVAGNLAESVTIGPP